MPSITFILGVICFLVVVFCAVRLQQLGGFLANMRAPQSDTASKYRMGFHMAIAVSLLLGAIQQLT